MPLPLLATVSQAARWAWPFIRGGVRRGLSARELGRSLRAVGRAVNNADLFAIARAERNIWVSQPQYKFIPLGKRVDPRRLPVAATATRRRYTFVVELKGLLSGTDLPMSRRVTVTSTEMPTHGAILEAATTMGLRDRDTYKMAGVSAAILSGMKSAELL